MVEYIHIDEKGDLFLKNCDSNLINKHTLMLESVFTGEFKSKIITTHGIFFSKMSVQQLMGNACIQFASTIEGRMEATKKLMNYLVKTPVLIDPNEFGAFPTKSYKSVECTWIFNHQFEIEPTGKGKSQVTFRNGMTFPVNVSKIVLLKQRQRLNDTIYTYRLIHRNLDNT